MFIHESQKYFFQRFINFKIIKTTLCYVTDCKNIVKLDKGFENLI